MKLRKCSSIFKTLAICRDHNKLVVNGMKDAAI